MGPAASSRKTVLVRGEKLSVVDQGSGPTIVLVHGFPLDRQMWRGQIGHLANHYRVIAPDLPGFGGSTLVNRDLSMVRLADDMAALLDQLGASEPVVFCGLSMGAYVAWQFWLRHRDRLRALVLCDTRAAADSPEGVQTRRKLTELVLEKGAAAAAESVASRLLSPRTLREQPDLAEQIKRTVAAATPVAFAAAQEGMASRTDAGELLGKIELESLLIVGEDDVISPPDEMRSMAAAMPRAELIVIPAAGHLVPLENPTATNRALDAFLARLA